MNIANTCECLNLGCEQREYVVHDLGSGYLPEYCPFCGIECKRKERIDSNGQVVTDE